MIRDGRMPSPEKARAEAADRRRVEREKRAARPSEQKRRAEREAEIAASRRRWKARRREEEAQPLHELLADSFDLANPELSKSNTFASLKPRLIIHLEAVIAELEWNRHAHEREARFERAKAILDILRAGCAPTEADP
jgi:hypothetical protein